MFKVKIKDILVLLIVIALVVATAILASIELNRIGTISGVTLIPALIGLIGFGSSTAVKDLKSFKKIYEAADEE